MQPSAASGWFRDGAALVVAAVGLIASFPPLGLWLLAWLAPAPLLWRAATAGPRRRVLLGAAWGVLFFSFALYWAQAVLIRYGGLSAWMAAGPTALLILYCAAYFSLFLWAVGAGVRRWGPRALWAAPVVWVALEWLRARALGGFPWAVLSASQQGVPALLAPAAWGGAYAVSALIVASWVWWVQLWLARRNAVLRLLLGATGIGAACALAGFGAWRVGRLDQLPRDLRVACLQVNVPQAVKWSRSHRAEILAAHRDLTRAASQRGARLVVWLESSLPFGPSERVPEEAGGIRIEEWVAEQARANRVEILWGGVATERTDGSGIFHNSAYLTDEQGRTLSRYDKVHLVPFGEYVPLRRVLTFVEPLVRQVGDFSPGLGPVLHPGSQGPIASVICYELLFPHLVRKAARGAGLLANITNDAWYGTAVMPYLHAAVAPLRSVENGMSVVRAANTGVSAIVLPSGRVLARSQLEERTVLVGDVPARGVETFYRRHGDVWPALCAMMCVIYIAALAPRSPRRAAHATTQPA